MMEKVGKVIDLSLALRQKGPRLYTLEAVLHRHRLHPRAQQRVHGVHKGVAGQRDALAGVGSVLPALVEADGELGGGLCGPQAIILYCLCMRINTADKTKKA